MIVVEVGLLEVEVEIEGNTECPFKVGGVILAPASSPLFSTTFVLSTITSFSFSTALAAFSTPVASWALLPFFRKAARFLAADFLETGPGVREVEVEGVEVDSSSEEE